MELIRNAAYVVVLLVGIFLLIVLWLFARIARNLNKAMDAGQVEMTTTPIHPCEYPDPVMHCGNPSIPGTDRCTNHLWN